MTDATWQRPLVAALVSYAVATGLVVILWRLSLHVAAPWEEYLRAGVALVFLYIPVLVARHRGEELNKYGFTMRPVGRSLAFGLGVPAIIFPLFLVGFVVFYLTVCSSGIEVVRELGPRGLCHHFKGWAALAHPKA